MKKALAIIMVLLPMLACAQVKVVSTPKQKEPEFKYDSLTNVPRNYDVTGFKGQELYLPPRPDHLKKYGYQDIYRKADSFTGSIPVEEIAGHTFTVTDVVKRDFGRYTLHLLDKETDVTYYYHFSFLETSWCFITLGYKAKYEAANKGKKFVFLSYSCGRDINTGKRIDKSRGSIWTFQEVVADAENGKIGYTYTNDEGETMLASELYFSDFIPKSELDKYVRKYGKKMCDLALEGTIKIGMPADLVVIAKGKPRTKNQASYGEQWVYGEYGDDCVYFKNGKVTGWN